MTPIVIESARAGNPNHAWGRRCRDLAFAAACLWAGPAVAQAWGGALGFGNDNVYRGVSLTAGRSAWLADLHYDFGNGWLAGVGASAERPQYQDAGAQYTFYADRRWQLDDDWSMKAGVVHYESPSNVWRYQLNYNDVTVAVGWRGRVRLALSLSPDTPGVFTAAGATTGFAASAELSVNQPIAGRLAANAGLGYYDLSDVAGFGYRYGSVGLSYGIGDVYVYSSLLWSDANAQRYARGSTDRNRWVTTVVWHF